MNIINAIVSQFQQLSIVITQLSNEEYNTSSDVLSRATIGQHIRQSLNIFYSSIKATIRAWLIMTHDRAKKKWKETSLLH